MKTLVKCLFVIPLFFLACHENEITSTPEQEKNPLGLEEMKLEPVGASVKNSLFSKTSDKKSSIQDFAAALNEQLSEYNIQLAKMELLEYEGAGITVNFRAVGNKQLGADFVPDDPRNFFPGTDQLFWTDGTEQGTVGSEYSMTPEETLIATNSAINTWGSINCSEDLNFYNVYTTTPYDIYRDVGVFQRALNMGGAGWRITGSILHGGNLPAAFFEALREDGGTRTLGVTFTYIWFDGPGPDREPTDIDQNGKRDVAFREIYINGSRNFKDDPNDVTNNGYADYETVMLHEIGHGLSQGHFGKAFEGKNGKTHYAPFALMNAGYSKAQREITATDNAGHCSIWDGWPYE
ncbi:hypothetical protein [Seonamhaeicola maritimus]|uniref:Matrixin family metalloprotease n=1 Tax=Seonamhaeicola maritimus TaxID=2591822 RepID=A0A5C7GGY7_9FLAO|nr:hypothetical protein [Seonamhaeicola maritimus]TXG36743.1 hypothetical protein FUA22_09180 [Seonamhaeicola maritimus]